MGNKPLLGNKLIREAIGQLTAKLPKGWRIVLTSLPVQTARPVEAVLRIRAPDSNPASIFVETKKQLEPKDLDVLAAVGPSVQRTSVLVIAPFLSPSTRERLTALGFQYADLTGNIRLNLSKPGLYVETRDAEDLSMRISRRRAGKSASSRSSC